MYRWTWIWQTQWDQENWSVICKICRIHMTNTLLDMHRTGTKHIVRHMQKSVVQWSVISKFACIMQFLKMQNITIQGLEKHHKYNLPNFQTYIFWNLISYHNFCRFWYTLTGPSKQCEWMTLPAKLCIKPTIKPPLLNKFQWIMW